MAAAGFGTAQFFETPKLGLPPAGNPPETDMWGTPFWAERVRTSLEAARDNDFHIDFQAGSGWPWTSPAVAGVNIDLSTQELAFGELRIVGPSVYIGPPPPPDNLDPSDRRLVAVTAARLDPAGTDPDGKTLLDPASTVDLTPTLDEQGLVHWDEVPPGEWVLFGFWQGPTRSAGFMGNGVGYLLDHLSRESTRAATDYLDENLFAHLGDLPRQVGGTVHTDSLEGFGSGDPADVIAGTSSPRVLWTRAFLTEFHHRRGYHLTRYLPALAVPYKGQGPGESSYDFPGSVGERVRRDYAQTLTELWAENHVQAANEWAHTHGLKFQGRAIGVDVIGFNVVAVTKAFDVPDIDHFTNSTIDWVRTSSSGARLSGAVKVTTELGDLVNHDHMLTLETLKRLADRQFVGGANQMDVAGYTYKFVNGAEWPRWWPWSTEWPPFGHLFDVSEGWAPTLPQWQHLPRLADYLARAQTVLQAGRPVTDVAIYRDAYGFAADIDDGDGDALEPALNSGLTRSGFSFDIVNPDTLTEQTTAVEDRRLIVQQPGYKALVIDLDASERIGIVDNRDAMAASVAERLVSFAEQGLPIVFVDHFPERGVSYRDPDAEDAAAQAAVAELQTSPNVRLAAEEADVPAALAELGVGPDLSFDGTEQSTDPCGLGAQCIYSVHRRTDNGDYWFIWNAGDELAHFTGSFAAGDRAPELWDLWTGEQHPVGLYRAVDGRVEVPIELVPNESALIAFEQPVTEHVVATDAEEVVVRDDGLFLRATEGGDARATLSDGREVSARFPQLPEPVEPSAWALHVEGAVREGEEHHDLDPVELKDWREIPELEHTSGTGTYLTTLTLPQEWFDQGRGAYLELGQVEGGGVQVRVNGQLVYPAVVPPPRLDVSPFLQSGENAIEVELTTTLKNRIVQMAEAGVLGYQRFLIRNATQPYGLIGPVRLVPYAEQRVAGGGVGVNPPGGGPGDGRCSNRIEGTNERDKLTGSKGADRLVGKRGNDRLAGKGGDDCLLGKGGRDRINGNRGDDDVRGGAGKDKVRGNAGDDEIRGGRGPDKIKAGGGDDIVRAARGGRDRIDCGPGEDIAIINERKDRAVRCEKVRLR